MKIKLSIFLLLGILFLIFPSSILAAFSFNIDQVEPSVITSKDQEVLINISINDLPSGNSYFRAAFQKNSGDNYFGEIKSADGSWITIRSLTSGDCSGYSLVSVSSTLPIVLTIRVGGSNNPVNGDYKIKAHRFTSGCNADDVISEIVVSINLPTPAPSATATATTSATATATSTVTPTPNTNSN